jgi:hypothetical protein
MNNNLPSEQREAIILAGVHDMKHTIKALASALMHSARRSESVFLEIIPNANPGGQGHRASAILMGDVIGALPSLLGSYHVSDEMRDIVVEASIYNMLVSIIHKHFFEGAHFFGVGCEALWEDLEAMYHKLVENSKTRACSQSHTQFG